MRVVSATLLCFLIFTSSNANAKTAGDSAISNCWKKEKSHADATKCEIAELGKITAQMEEAYKMALTAAQEMEADLKGESIAYDGLAKKLEDSQTAFKAYMETHCDYETQNYGTGTFAGDAKTGCLIDLTTERTNRLKRGQSPQK